MRECELCKGTGLIKRETPFKCESYHASNVFVCADCENLSKGLYITCKLCYGSGLIHDSPKKNKNLEIKDKISR